MKTDIAEDQALPCSPACSALKAPPRNQPMNATFDWNTLTRRPLQPAGQFPKTWPGWGLPRADGRVVVLESLHQSYIYAGELLGAMLHPEKHLAWIRKKAEALYPSVKAPAAIIPPVLFEYAVEVQPLRLVAPGEDIGPVTLPRVAVIAELNSSAPARDHAECFSSLVVIWFQERFGDATPEIQRQVAALDWNALAFDWTP
jgi:hypothetical protein